MQDKRRFRRLTTEAAVVLKTDHDIKTDLVDVNFTGIGVNTQEQLEDGTSVQAELKSSVCNDTVIAEGRSVHHEQIEKDNKHFCRVGVEFSRVDGRSMRQLINCIHTRQ